MRILLLIVCAILLLVAGVFLAGSLLPKRHVAARSASFRARPEQLFALIAGPQNWRPDVVRCEEVPDPAGRTLLRETTRNGETITYEVLDRVPPLSLTRRIATQDMPYSGSWAISIEPGNGTNLVRITETGDVTNPVFRFVSRFILGHTSTLDAYLRALGKSTGEDIQPQD